MKFTLYLFALLLACTQAAWGHAALIETSPPAGAVLLQAPADATLTFNEPVGVTVMRLLGPDGKTLPTGAVRDEDRQVSVRLPPVSAHGTYLLSWRVVSADGHPIGGTLNYAVGTASARALAAAHSRPARDAAIWLARWLTYLCLFAVVGAALFRLLQPDNRQRWARPLVIAGWALLALDLGLQGLDLLDAPFAVLPHANVWATAFASRYGWTVGLMALALLTASAVLDAARASAARIGAPLALLFAGAAVAASGHAGTAPPEWLSRPLVAAHVILAIVWIGALIPLARLPYVAVRSGHPLAALATFSRWILPAVLLLVGTGIGLAGLQLDQASDLWRTNYGRVLLAKLSLIAVLLLLAACNRWRHTRPALGGDARAQKRLAHTTAAEAVVAVLVLAVVALWRLTPPPRSLDAAVAATAPALQFTLKSQKLQARITQQGADTWRIALQDPKGQPFAAKEVTLRLTNPKAGIEALEGTAHPRAAGSWSAQLPPLPPVGTWQARLTLLVDDFTQITLTGAPATAGTAAPAGQAPVDSSGGHAMPEHDQSNHAMADAQVIASRPASGALHISNCWVRLLPPMVPSGAYFTVQNSSAQDITLQAAASPAFASVMLHQTTETDGVSRMAISHAVTVPAHGTFTFKPGGHHAMLEKPTRALQVGGTIALYLLTGAGEQAKATCTLEPAATTHP